MKKDIVIPPVKGVTVAIARTEIDPILKTYEYHVYLINSNDYAIENVIVVSKGYGIEDKSEVKTATLRHLFVRVEAESFEVVELIQPETFVLVNEFWITYYKEGDREIHDKKFLFLPETIREGNLSLIPFIEKEGVLHS
jgi:hypothetical protein